MPKELLWKHSRTLYVWLVYFFICSCCLLDFFSFTLHSQFVICCIFYITILWLVVSGPTLCGGRTCGWFGPIRRWVETEHLRSGPLQQKKHPGWRLVGAHGSLQLDPPNAPGSLWYSWTNRNRVKHGRKQNELEGNIQICLVWKWSAFHNHFQNVFLGGEVFVQPPAEFWWVQEQLIVSHCKEYFVNSQQVVRLASWRNVATL